jgi:hypothetical protein
MAFTVIPKYKMVTDVDRLAIGELKSISSSTIELTFDRKDAITRFSIKRVDGTLVGTVISQQTKAKIADIQGTCQRQVLGDRKF